MLWGVRASVHRPTERPTGSDRPRSPLLLLSPPLHPGGSFPALHRHRRSNAGKADERAWRGKGRQKASAPFVRLRPSPVLPPPPPPLSWPVPAPPSVRPFALALCQLGDNGPRKEGTGEKKKQFCAESACEKFGAPSVLFVFASPSTLTLSDRTYIRRRRRKGRGFLFSPTVFSWEIKVALPKLDSSGRRRCSEEPSKTWGRNSDSRMVQKKLHEFL